MCYLVGPQQAGKMGWQEHHEVQQGTKGTDMNQSALVKVLPIGWGRWLSFLFSWSAVSNSGVLNTRNMYRLQSVQQRSTQLIKGLEHRLRAETLQPGESSGRILEMNTNLKGRCKEPGSFHLCPVRGWEVMATHWNMAGSFWTPGNIFFYCKGYGKFPQVP